MSFEKSKRLYEILQTLVNSVPVSHHDVVVCLKNIQSHASTSSGRSELGALEVPKCISAFCSACALDINQRDHQKDLDGFEASLLSFQGGMMALRSLFVHDKENQIQGVTPTLVDALSVYLSSSHILANGDLRVNRTTAKTMLAIMQSLVNGCVGNATTVSVVWKKFFPHVFEQIILRTVESESQARPQTNGEGKKVDSLFAVMCALIYTSVQVNDSLCDDIVAVNRLAIWQGMLTNIGTVLSVTDVDASGGCEWVIYLTHYILNTGRLPLAYASLASNANGGTYAYKLTNTLTWIISEQLRCASNVTVVSPSKPKPDFTNSDCIMETDTITFLATKAEAAFDSVSESHATFWPALETSRTSANSTLSQVESILDVMCAITGAHLIYASEDILSVNQLLVTQTGLLESSVRLLRSAWVALPSMKPRHINREDSACEGTNENTTANAIKANAIKDKTITPIAMGLKASIIQLLGNLCHGCVQGQDKLREVEGLVLLLNHCQLDDRNPYIREWSVLALRNALEGNLKSQTIVEGMEKKKVVADPDLGVEVQIDDKTGKLKVKKDGEGAKKSSLMSVSVNGGNGVDECVGVSESENASLSHIHGKWSAHMSDDMKDTEDVWADGCENESVHECVTDSGNVQLSETLGVVLDSALFVSTHSEHVRVSLEGVEKAAQAIAQRSASIDYSTTTWKEHELHPNVADDAALNWIFVIDTLNFSFWSSSEVLYTVVYKGKTYTGYWALCATINRALDEGIPITTPSYYANITEEEICHIFRSDSTEPAPMLKERKENLNECGSVLLNKYNGSVSELVRCCNGSAKAFVNTIVTEFPCYNDVAVYRNRECAFYKRPQILVADIWACFEQQGIGRFYDIDCITMFADYRVPQVLVHLGCMEYTSALTEQMKSGELWLTGDPRECEVRGCSIWAVEEIKRAMKRQGTEVSLNAILLDFYLWDYAKLFSNRMNDVPIHHVRTRFY